MSTYVSILSGGPKVFALKMTVCKSIGYQIELAIALKDKGLPPDFIKTIENSPGQVADLLGESFHTPKCCGFHSWSGHIPRLWIQSLVGVRMKDK